MRIIYPEDVKKEVEAIEPYLEYREEEGVVLKTDAPREFTERLRKLREKMDRIREGSI